MAEITKMLGIAINDFDEGRLSRGQLISILQEAIDNGDILLPDNELYTVAVVIPFIDRGALKPSHHTEAFEARMNAKASALAQASQPDTLMTEPESDNVDGYICSDCGGAIASDVKVCPHCGSDTSEIIESPEDSLTKSSNRAFPILTVAVAVTLLAYFLVAPGNATFPYHLASVTIKLISYSIILFAIAFVIAAVVRKFKGYALIIFAWLFLTAAIFDFSVAVFRKFVVEPQVRNSIEEMQRR